MAFILKLRDGTEEVDFLSTAYQLNDGGLVIATPEAKEVWGGDSIYSNGSQLVMSSFGNREVTVTFRVTGATRDELLENVARIDRIIEAAKIRSIEEAGARVEMVYSWDTATDSTYYEMVSGSLAWPENVMSVDQVHQKIDGLYAIFDFVLTLALLPFGYPISPVSGTPEQVALSNGTDIGTTVHVHNCSDLSRGNYVEIDGAQLQGSYPMVVNLALQSNSGEAERTSKIYIGVRKGTQDFKSVLEDSAAVFRIGNVSPIADPDYSSGGTYSSLAFTNTDDGSHPPITPVTLARWSLTDVEVGATVGPFRIFGRSKSNSFWDTNANYALAIKYSGVLLYQTEWRTPLNTTTTLFDFGTVFLPPWLGTMTNLAGLDIELLGLRKTYGTTTIALDYISLLPQDGGYRVLQFRGGGMIQLESTVDDGWNRTVYHVNLAGKRTGLPFGLMPPITLKPGITHRLYFLMEGTAGSSEISRQLLVTLGAVPTYMVLA